MGFQAAISICAKVRAMMWDLSWMAGHWRSSDQKEEELWLPMAGSIMLGLHRTLRPSGKAFFEYLRIEEDGDTLTYWASPNGESPVPFTAREAASHDITFSNPQHDFPQDIRYRLDGSELVASIVGPSNGKSKIIEWRWKQVQSL